MEKQNTSSADASGGSVHQCTRCSRTFKRVEHLKRHERSHGGQKQFSCRVCSKSFTRSDILARHEYTHRASPAPNADARRKACVECAKARERCTKEETCLRCFNRSLACIYPPRRSIKALPSSSTRNPQLGWDQEANSSRGPVQEALRLRGQEEPMSPAHNTRVSDVESVASVQAPSFQRAFPPLPQMGGPDNLLARNLQSQNIVLDQQNRYSQSGTWDPPLQHTIPDRVTDYPMNWLPFNDSIGLDYSSILGFNMTTFNSFNDTTMAGNVEQDMLTQSSNQLDSYVMNPVGLGDVGAPSFNQASVQPRLINPPVTAPSPATTNSSSQGSSTGTKISAKSGLYATSSDGARVACTARSERPKHVIYGATALGLLSDAGEMLTGDSSDFSFPSLDHVVPADMEIVGDSRLIRPSVYELIKQQFHQLCLGQSDLYPAYHSPNFPLLGHLNFFVHLYFEHFSAIWPIVHHDTDINASWHLVLALSAIGSQYTCTSEFDQCVRPMHEFLRRALAFEVETLPWAQCSEALMQALLLSQIGLLYHGSARLFLQARARHGAVIEMAKCSGFLNSTSNKDCSIGNEINSLQIWKQWIRSETKNRLAFSLWLLDSMSVYHFGQSPVLCLDSPACILPSSALWACESSSEWAETRKKTEENPTLSAAMNSLFIEKEAKNDLGGFETLIVLHGIYQEIRRVRGYYARPLASWVPSIHWASQSSPDAHDQIVSEPRGVTNISNWRNAALDCVDVLHWAANATIANAAGVEHPTVFHLHFARVVLLAPYQSIQILVRSITCLGQDSRSSEHTISRDEAAAAEQDVLRWAQQDEHKARLAILHCGCFYWHIRRYSRDAFYEPLSVYLVTLTLWAYSSYSSRVSSHSGNHNGSADSTTTLQQNPHGQETLMTDNIHGSVQSNEVIDDPRCIVNIEDDDNHEPTFIRLDRPNDDEMVQLFVRKGRPSAMTAHIAGVGNICSSQGPIKILREGRKILSAASSAWGRSREQLSTLEALEKTMIGKQ